MKTKAPDKSLLDIRDTIAEVLHITERGPATSWPDPALRRMVASLLRRLLQVLDNSERTRRNAELAETEAVYDLVARKAATMLGLPEAAVYRAVIALCDEDQNAALLDGLLPLDQSVADQLLRFLVRITVEYRGHEGDRDVPQRSVWVLHGQRGGVFEQFEVKQNIGYEQLPEDVRLELATSAAPVQFQIFPRSASS